jgi:hypothetical protein
MSVLHIRSHGVISQKITASIFTAVENYPPFVVRHIYSASWKDPQSHYPEDGRNMFLRNFGSSYWSHTA